MEKQEISKANVDWVRLFRHVARDQVTVEISDGPTAIAEVVPKRNPIAVKDLPTLMAMLPSLGDDGQAFAKDVEEGRSGFGQGEDPWES